MAVSMFAALGAVAVDIASNQSNHTHTHTHTYLYISIYI